MLHTFATHQGAPVSLPFHLFLLFSSETHEKPNCAQLLPHPDIQHGNLTIEYNREIAIVYPVYGKQEQGLALGTPSPTRSLS